MSGKGIPLAVLPSRHTRKRSLSLNSFKTASPPHSPKSKTVSRNRSRPSTPKSQVANSTFPLSQTLIDLEPLIRKDVEKFSDKENKEGLKDISAKVNADYVTLHKMIVERGNVLYAKAQCIRKVINETLESFNKNLYSKVGANIFDTSKTRVYPIQDTGKPIDDYIVNIEWTSEGSKIKNDIGAITSIDIIKTDAFLRC